MQMLRLGARLLSKGCSARKLQMSLWDAALARTQQDTPVPEERLKVSSNTDAEQRIERLTRRETQLLPLVCSSLRNKEIARQLGISESTVWHHLTSIFAKLEVEDRLGLATFAYRHQLVVPDGAEETNRPQTLKYPPAVDVTDSVSPKAWSSRRGLDFRVVLYAPIETVRISCVRKNQLKEPRA